jgi:2-polyprenyl-3-methyl-5-hydroxy-6-metoxy-1,4-benzoquinol methylase
MSHFRVNEPLLKMLKRQILGFTYLLLHPPQLKRIIIRETRFRQRHKSKLSWLEWQEYNQYMGQYDQDMARLEYGSAEAQASPLHVARIQTISDMVSRLGKGLRVLDVGCGSGIISEHIWKMGNYVTCADLPMMTSLTHRHRALLVVATVAEQLAFASNSFDVVLAFELLEHLWNPHVFLDEAYRILGTDGHLIIEVPEGREGLRWDSHIQYFTLESLKQMSSAKFIVCEVKRLPAVEGVPTIIMLLRKSMITKNQ